MTFLGDDGELRYGIQSGFAYLGEADLADWWPVGKESSGYFRLPRQHEYSDLHMSAFDLLNELRWTYIYAELNDVYLFPNQITAWTITDGSV